jgi:hypothetical protein
MELVVFTRPEAGKYQQKQTLTQGQICPVAFAEVPFVVNRFIRRG